MLEMAVGNRDPAGFAPLLDGAPREQAAHTAPPFGLALAGVAYPD
jgi:hypothetical protein